jgi:hypothetical protein
LQSFAEANAINSWFMMSDITATKNWFYVKSKLELICCYEPYNHPPQNIGFGRGVLQGLFPLISDNAYLIDWYANMDSTLFEKDASNTKRPDYWVKQFFLALRGDWDELAARCERILADPPTDSKVKKFMPDYRFYLALAKGDVDGMEAAIRELVTPKAIANRIALEGGYTADLICTPAVIYNKLAWRHGHEIVVDSPYIPREWLPIAPLEKYEDPFEFMKIYDPKG